MPRIYSLGDLLNDLGILQMEFGKPDDEQEDEIAAEARIDYRRAWARQYASLGFRRLRLLAQADGCLFYGKDWPDRATKWLLQQRAKAALDRGIEPVALNAEPVELLAKLIEHRPAEQPATIPRPDDPRDKSIYGEIEFFDPRVVQKTTGPAGPERLNQGTKWIVNRADARGVLSALWTAYLFMERWGRSDYSDLDEKLRTNFQHLVSSAHLFDYVECVKCALVVKLPHVPDAWLAPVSCSARIMSGECVTVKERKELHRIRDEMYPWIAKLRAGVVPDSKTDSKTDNWKKSRIRIPDNLAVLKLAKRIKKELPKGNTKRQIALDFTDGNVARAETLLRQLRRFPHLLE